eukprot:2206090-Alexandrium_andersonii.AAC.1
MSKRLELHVSVGKWSLQMVFMNAEVWLTLTMAWGRVHCPSAVTKPFCFASSSKPVRRTASEAVSPISPGSSTVESP